MKFVMNQNCHSPLEVSCPSLPCHSMVENSSVEKILYALQLHQWLLFSYINLKEYFLFGSARRQSKQGAKASSKAPRLPHHAPRTYLGGLPSSAFLWAASGSWTEGESEAGGAPGTLSVEWPSWFIPTAHPSSRPPGWVLMLLPGVLASLAMSSSYILYLNIDRSTVTVNYSRYGYILILTAHFLLLKTNSVL